MSVVTVAVREPLRVLFLGEGDLGGIAGHAAHAKALETGMSDLDGVDARFRALPPLRGLTGLSVRSIPVLRHADVDLQVVRWHLVQSLRARRIVRCELRSGDIDAIFIDSHAISLALVDEMRRTPTFLSVDATVWDFRSFGIWRPVRRLSRLALAPSLALEREAFGAAAGIVARTEWSKRGVERSCPGASVVVHHPGVDLATYRPIARDDRAPVRILFVGSNFEKKGGHDLLAALDDLPGRGVEVDLVTRGAVRELPGVRVHRLSVKDPALVRLHREADIFCLPTHGDVAPFAVLEAMASGTAVVASAVGGIPELLDHGRAGVVVPAHDRDALRAAILDLLGDRDRRHELGAAARRRCEERYDARVQAVRLVEMIRERL